MLRLFSVFLLYKYFSEKVKILEGNLEKNLGYCFRTDKINRSV